MPDLGNAYVNIIPKAPGIESNIEKTLSGGAAGAGEKAGANLGSSLMSTLGKIVSVAAVGKIVKDAFSAGGNLEQSFGGLDTIYGEASAAAKEYAVQAAQAGISANSYAEQAVSFGAALKAAYGGDTVKAMEAANNAIMDMADNSAKMGTDIGSVQAAYQGFAKQNYTMLDNLKLGYGGTQKEMERLLSDATKISGVKYDIKNLGDVYDAIHVIQGELGLTGVAADEAKTTLTGSFGAMKASWENLMAAMTTGEGLGAAMQNLGTSVGNFLKNVIRMAGNLISQLPTMLSGIFSTIGPQLMPMGMEILRNLLAGITSGVGSLLTTGSGIVTNLINGIMAAIPQLIIMGSTFVQNLISTISSSLPKLFENGTQMITQIINGIVSLLPQLLATGQRIIPQLLSLLMAAIPQLLSAGVQIIPQLVSGITTALPQLAASAGTIIGDLVSGIITNLPQILAQGIALIGELLAGIIQAIPSIISYIPTMFENIVSAFTALDWGSIGHDIIHGIGDGIVHAADTLFESLSNLASQALQAAKDALGIGSPSKVFAKEVGEWIPPGISVGIEEGIPELDKTVQDMIDVAGMDYSRFTSAPAATHNTETGVQETFGSGGGGSRGPLTAIFNINGREFMRAVFEDQQAVANEHGVSLIMA